MPDEPKNPTNEAPPLKNPPEKGVLKGKEGTAVGSRQIPKEGIVIGPRQISKEGVTQSPPQPKPTPLRPPPEKVETKGVPPLKSPPIKEIKKGG